MRSVNAFIIAFLCCFGMLFSQQISVDTSVGLQTLVEDNLVSGCVEITNITSSVNGIANGNPSYGYFERGTSNFPFESGIMIATGNANSGGNTANTNLLSEGNSSWGADPDLEAALGITNTLNATSIEFDFISTTNQFQFNYLYASEEYFDILPCSQSDNFVVLITEAGTGNPYRNIALVPGTNLPVNSNNIHSEIFGVCPAENDTYFDQYNAGDSNYNGRTTILSASETIVPYTQYHVKIVIADGRDFRGDSAVFIERNSFEILDLGDDIQTCSSSEVLNADIGNPSATYSWFRNGTPIPNGPDPHILNVNQDGTYRVVVTVPLNATDCTIEDDIEIVLNSEETIDSVTDYTLCDALNGNGTLLFDLTTKLPELGTNALAVFTSSTITFHTSDANARNNVGAINAISSSGQTIYVRVDDNNSDCVAYTEFELIVNNPPTIPPLTALDVCDTDDSPDGITVIPLTEKNDEITGGLGNLVVTYHYNQPDALAGDNAIPDVYVNTSSPYNDQVHFRIVNTETGCFNVGTIDIVITDSPVIVRDTQYLDACDTTYTGQGTFVLTDREDNILNGLDPLTVTVTYHETFADADTGDNPIADPSNFTYTDPNGEPGFTRVYVRVVNNATGCASITIIETHTNLLITGADTGDFAQCDDNSDPTDSLNFDLIAIEAEINGEITNWIDVAFYDNETTRDNDLANNTTANALPKNAPFAATNGTQLFLILRDTVSDCTEPATITLLINPILEIQHTTDIPYCDEDGSGTVSVELHSLDDLITGGTPEFSVTYHETEAQAENGSAVLPDFYHTSSVQLWARIQSDNNPLCYTVNPFNIVITNAPSAVDAPQFDICSSTGSEVINLTTKIPDMLPDTTDVNISYFNSFDDADNNVNEIIDPQNYTATITETIFVRFDSDITLCHSIAEFDINFNTEPIIPSDIIYPICEAAGINQANFILSEMDDDILGSQTGKEVYYFAIEQDALDGNLGNALPKDGYTNISNPQPIYVRVINTTAAPDACFATSSITLQVSPQAVYNPVVGFSVCDSFNDANEEIDFATVRDEIANGFSNLTITFHNNFLDAENNVDALPDTHTINNNETFTVRIQSEDSPCIEYEELEILMVQTPDVSDVRAPLVECDEDTDGITEFNLLEADYEIFGRFTEDFLIHYYENFDDINQEDGLDNTRAIDMNDVENFESITQTIVYIKVTNPHTGCFTVKPLELIVNVPPEINNIGTHPTCENATNTFDLSTLDELIVDDLAIANVTYHSSFANAQNNIALNPIYNYTSNFVTLFVRANSNLNGCFNIASFNLQINPNPVANTTPDLVSCDDDFEDGLIFNLRQTEATILGPSQSTSDFTVNYYTLLEDAESGENSVNDMHHSSNGAVIYARVENRNTGCYSITQFSTIVNALPVIPIEDVVTLCTNDLPLVIDASTGNPNDTYFWPTTGATTPQIILNDPSEIGNYSVRVTRNNSIGNDCEWTHDFTVIESETADMVVSTKVDFEDPNSITVTVSGIGDYVYILDDGEPQVSNVFENVSYGLHRVTIRDLNGCADYIEEVVVIDAPKFFTPNGDVFHPTWHIVGIEEIPGTVVTIYNRHGKLLKTLTHTSDGWDGTFNGYNMPSDDYWFVAKVVPDTGEPFDVRGHFALKR